MLRRAWLTLWVVCLSTTLAQAEVRPHFLCSDGMVLQRGGAAHVWGAANSREQVAVTFRGQTANATADEQGKWLVTIEAGQAGGPFDMTIAGENSLEYHDVLVGDVWFCGGQSNLETRSDAPDEDGKLIADRPANDQLRYIHLPVPDPTIRPGWRKASPKTAPGWSSVSYFFGHDVQQAIGVPVGVIAAPVGGIRGEAWAARDAFDKLPKYVGGAGEYGAQFDNFVRETSKFPVRGTVWYQGESNADQGYDYRTLLPRIISSWRKAWGRSELPFLYVQIPPYKHAAAEPGESNWAELRESQLLALKIPHTAMAVTTDCGDEWQLHRRPKHVMGERLALAARALVYGEQVEYSGPVVESIQFDGARVVVSFSHAEGLVGKELLPQQSMVQDGQKFFRYRLKAGGKDQSPLSGFALCGEDRKFYPADAKIASNTVIVASPQVPTPIAVRYGWTDHPVCNLYNSAGLPASPFRSDDFPPISRSGP